MYSVRNGLLLQVGFPDLHETDTFSHAILNEVIYYILREHRWIRKFELGTGRFQSNAGPILHRNKALLTVVGVKQPFYQPFKERFFDFKIKYIITESPLFLLMGFKFVSVLSWGLLNTLGSF